MEQMNYFQLIQICPVLILINTELILQEDLQYIVITNKQKPEWLYAGSRGCAHHSLTLWPNFSPNDNVGNGRFEL